MKHFSKLVTLTMMLVCCLSCSKEAKVSVSIQNKSGDLPVALYFADGSSQPIPLDSLGNGSITLTTQEPMYVYLNYLYHNRPLWLTPDADLHISFNHKDYHNAIEITGKGIEENLYLNSGRLSNTDINATEAEESLFLMKSDSMFQANLAELKKANLPEAFTRKEEERLKYFTYQALPLYPYYHVRITKDSTYQSSPTYWEKLNELAADNGDLLFNEEYVTFMTEAVNILAKKKYPDQKRIDAVMKYAENDIKDARVAEMLVHKNVMGYIKRQGIVGMEAYMDMHNRFVKTPDFVEAYETLCQQWRRIAVGAPSPDFNATDVDGKAYTLADFKGKYVYIDIWATWCGPCKREIPYLVELEESFHGKDIHFVSLSCDSNTKAWEERVKDGMKGIQLLLDSQSTFMKDYMIAGIPRFILLDKEGKIISTDMTRPSDPKTAEKLSELLDK